MADSDIRHLFEQLNLTEKTAFSLEKTKEDYILDISVQERSNTLAATSSNKFIRLFSYSNLATKGSIEGHSGLITGVKFANTESDILFSSSEDKTIKCWDVRTDLKKPVSVFEGYEESNNIFTSFDVSCNDRVICAGCAQNKKSEDVHLLFWDRRGKELLGCYSDSHQDDITQVCFHPTEPDTLSTGSTDGLVCVFDIGQPTEDDAIVLTLNSESSVDKIGWHNNNLYCVTHIDTFYLWDIKKEEDLLVLTDIKDSNYLQGKDSIEYLIDGLVVNDKLHLVAGTHSGSLRVLDVSGDSPTVVQSLTGGHTSTVRCCLWSDNMLVSGGEDSMLCLWSHRKTIPKQEPKGKLKVKKSVTRKAQPY